MIGVVNLNKPAGMTSFTAVQRIRSASGVKKVGHAGTLDPLATGVLPVLLGSATRLADYAHRLPKTYVADVHFGFSSVTDDAEAELRAVADPSGLTRADVEGALSAFVGRIMQEPPAYSAVKLGGERAYKLARAGQDPHPEGREVDIHQATLTQFQAGVKASATLEVVCGSGTYLRSLARDLGAALSVGGYLGKLVRTGYGPFLLVTSVELSDLTDPESVSRALLPSESILPDMQGVSLTHDQVAFVKQGRAVRVLPEPAPGAVRAHDDQGRLVALGHTDPLRRTFVPEKVLI
ncbi:MAG TPA: tRNA pseudouridine(55) synthase TruB [Candidatus Dormibacteraeota bacterium]|nr:tRNA pseudouridine(55) synthase TruB [Candidatus Dormibacteraeota bacterium]